MQAARAGAGGLEQRALCTRSWDTEMGTHPALWLGTRGLCAPPVRQAERAALADQGHLNATGSCPWAAWKGAFSGLKQQKPEAKAAAAPHLVCRAVKMLEGRATKHPPVSPGGSVQGKTQHPQLLHPGHFQWVLPAHSWRWRHRIPVGWGSMEENGMAESPLSLSASSSSHHPASSSQAWLPPENTLAASPTATRSRSPGHEASAWAWRWLLYGHRCQRGCCSHPQLKEHSLCPQPPWGHPPAPCCCQAPPLPSLPRPTTVRTPQGTQGKKEHPRARVPGGGCFRVTPTPSFPHGTAGHLGLAVGSPDRLFSGDSPGHSKHWRCPRKSSSSQLGKGQTGTGGAAYPPLAHVPLATPLPALMCHCLSPLGRASQ